MFSGTGDDGSRLGFGGWRHKAGVAAAVANEAHEFSRTATGACSPGSGGGIGAVSNGEAYVSRWGSNRGLVPWVPVLGIDALSNVAAAWVTGVEAAGSFWMLGFFVGLG